MSDANWTKGNVEVCCHRVDYRYDLQDIEPSENLSSVLEAEAEDRAKTCINEGFSSGELNCLYAPMGETVEVRGWWEIVS